MRYRKEIDTLLHKSNYYRKRYAKKALRRSWINKALELLSLTLSIIMATTMSLALAGLIHVRFTQILVLVLSTLVAIIHTITKLFFNPGEVLKLYYASIEFLKIREKAKELLLSRDLTVGELSVEFHKLNNEYTDLKKIYIEYIHSPVSYYWRTRKLKVPGKRLAQLLTVSNQIDKEK